MSETEKFEKDVRHTWRKGAESLDAGTLSRLNRARQSALDTLGQPRRRFHYWVPAAGVAAAIAVTWVWLAAPYEAGLPPIAEVADLEIMMTDTGLDLLEELEFYAWIDEAETDAT